MTSETSPSVRRSARIAVILGVTIVAAGVGGGIAWAWLQDREARAHALVGEEWQRLATCLVGDPVIDDRAAVLR
nr:hypothetical protein [Myxococcota bacterium]